MPKLRIKVESTVQRYLTGELTDDEFKESLRSILEEFEGKNLLHKNIGQLAWRVGKRTPNKENKSRKIWALLDEVDPRIREAFNEQWRIRLAKQGDIKDIIQCDPTAKNNGGNDRRDFIKKSVLGKRCYVAVIKGRPVGYSVLEYDFWGFGGGFISMLMVHEDFRRRGIGSALMDFAAKRCKKEKLFTSTNQSNEPMQRLLEKLGFERSGIIHNLDPGDPELIYFRRARTNN